MIVEKVVAKQYQGTLIQLLGSDVEDFLQRLASIDIASIGEDKATLSAFLNAKANILAVFYVLKKHSNLNLLVCQTYKNDVLSYIEKMHFSEDVQLNTQDINWLEVRYEKPPSYLSTLKGYTLQSWNIKGKTIGGLFYLKADLSPKDLACLEKMVDTRQFHVLECQAKNPGIDSHLFRHIMILDGPFDHFVSRNKGCYPGQEVVEKIYSIGRRPKKMLCCQIDTSNSIEIPENLLSENGKKIGKILHTAKVDSQTYIGLAVVHRNLQAGQGFTEFNQCQVKMPL